MGTSKSQPNDWMTKDGTGKINTFADERGWCIQHADGQIEVIHAVSGVAENPSNPADILGVTNPADGVYSVGDKLTFIVKWNEPVTVTGTPQITLDEDGVTVTADYVAGSSTATTSVFEYTTTTTGVVDNIVETIGLNSGSITDTSGNAQATATPVFSEGIVDSITLDYAGAGYDSEELVTIDAPSLVNSTATITTTDNAGVIDSVTLEDGGYGYETGTIAIAGGTGGTVTATVTDGVITELVLLGGGSGYTGASGVELAAPTLTVTQATADTSWTDNTLTGFSITEAGYGYDGSEGVTIDAPNGTPVVLTFNTDYEQPTGITIT